MMNAGAAGDSTLPFCTMMSTLTWAAASGSKTPAAIPGRSVTPTRVTFATLASVAIALTLFLPISPTAGLMSPPR